MWEEDWLICVFQIMYGNLRLGGSDTLLGVFQMVKGLEEISQWADIMFRPWYMKNVLKS